MTEKTKLNKLGKWILILSILTLVFFIFCMITDQTESASFLEVLGPMMIIVSIMGACLSISLIYFHAEPPKRKKAARLTSVISLLLFIFAMVSKAMWWAGASIEGLLCIFLFSFSSLPLIIKARYEKRKVILSGKTLLLNLVDLLAIFMICMGLLFRFLHWPGGTYILVIGIVLFIITFILWNISFRKEVKLRLTAEEKLKETLNEVEEKQREITDSINYAKRIQEAILPSFDFIKTHLPNSFIYYQPKDIVAGDFYWAEKVEDNFFIAAADCTGHGVPGALVSVVCCNALNRTVNEFKLSDPGKILDKTRELVLESFSKNGADIKDGMDISLICINGNSVKWAGANNPFWYIVSSFEGSDRRSGDVAIKEIKANKQPIGKIDNPEPFTTHTIELQKGDSLYLFTDGFADQFGGPKGKKFKYKQLEELLISTNPLSVNSQHEALKNALKNWMGNLEQVDDICVIGIRL